MATPEEFARGLVSLIHGVAKQVDEAPIPGLNPTFNPRTGQAHLPNGKTRLVSTEGVHLKVYRTTSNIVAANTTTVDLSWNGLDFDTASFYSAGTPTYIVFPYDGVYLFHVMLTFTPSGGGPLSDLNDGARRLIGLRKNSTGGSTLQTFDLAQHPTQTTGYTHATLWSWTWKALTGQRAYLQFEQNSGHTLEVSTGADASFMTVDWIG